MRHARLDDEVSFLVGDDDDLELHRLELGLSFMAKKQGGQDDEEERMEREIGRRRRREGTLEEGEERAREAR